MARRRREGKRVRGKKEVGLIELQELWQGKEEKGWRKGGMARKEGW